MTAGSALKALDILDRERPDLIITDFMMPGMTGIEIAETVSARDVNNTIPIMLMSGTQAYLGIVRPDLFVEVFQKPFHIETVISKVRLLVGLDI